jgi:hypothetical protein
MSYVGVKAVRGEPLKAGDIFLGFTRYWPIVGIGVLNWLIAVACIAPFACVMGIAFASLGAASRSGAASPFGLVAVIIAVLAMIVLMLFITTRLMFASLVCLDPRWHQTDVVECLKISWRITRSCWGGIVVVLILTGLLAMASILLLGVGLILLGWPLAICTLGAVYVIVANAFLSVPCSHCGGRRDDSPDPCPHCGGTEPAPA